MTKSTVPRCFVACAVGFLGWPAAAEDMQQTDHVDLMASAGYSTHPAAVQSGSSGGAAFGRLSVHAAHKLSTERTVARLIGFWEGTEYLGEGMRNLASARAEVTHAADERLALSGSAGFSADFAGQLSNRFIYSPQPGQPDTGPVVGGPPPDLFLYSGRQYRGDANIALSFKASERSRITGSAGASRETFSDPRIKDHTIEFGSAGYDHSLSERTTVGVRLLASRTDFDNSDDETVIVNPTLTASTLLSEDLRLSGSVGATVSRVSRGGTDLHSTDPSFSASICNDGSAQRLCATAAHYAQSLGVAELAKTTAFGLDWVRALDARQTVELSAGYQHYSRGQTDLATSVDQYHGGARYTRRLANALAIGGDFSARRFGDFEANSRTDVTGTLFVRYRIGER
jgi:hypothetical protein